MSNVAFGGAAWLFYSRWFVYFVAPNRIGTVSGFFSLFANSAGVLVCMGTMAWTQSMPKGRRRFVLPLGANCAAALLTLGGLGLSYWRRRPFPEAPRLLPEDELELAKTWGCESLEELGKKVGITDRAELIRRSTSSKPEDIRALLELVEANKVEEGGKAGQAETMADTPLLG